MHSATPRRLSGFNIDFEATDLVGLDGFLAALTEALHAATPRIGLSYDAGNTPTSAGVPMDRWVSMATYTSSQASCAG